MTLSHLPPSLLFYRGPFSRPNHIGRGKPHPTRLSITCNRVQPQNYHGPAPNSSTTETAALVLVWVDNWGLKTSPRHWRQGHLHHFDCHNLVVEVEPWDHDLLAGVVAILSG